MKEQNIQFELWETQCFEPRDSLICRTSTPVCRFLSLFATAFTLILSAFSTYPSLNSLPAGELLEGSKAVLPEDVKLRPVYPPGLKVTRLAEGWEPHLYNDSAKYCTIGYGHLIKKAPCNGTEPDEFRRGLTELQGSILLVKDMSSAQYTIMTSVRVMLTDGQFAALADFVFNVGSTNFKKSTLLSVVNTKQEDRVAPQFRRWVMAGGAKWPGLVTRREQEITLYFAGQRPKGVPPQGENLSPIDIRKGE